MMRIMIILITASTFCFAFHLPSLSCRKSLKINISPVSRDEGIEGPDIFVPDMSERDKMNAILVGAISLSTIGMAIPYFSFFMPKSTAKDEALIAKDILGADVTESSWKKYHQAESRELVQGLEGDATYLILDANNEMEDYALNAVCTHLGCVVPWNSNEKKFICNCHGSQYDKEGSVIRGPAPLPLQLVHREVRDDKVVLRPWREIDFRSGNAPWWK